MQRQNGPLGFRLGLAVWCVIAASCKTRGETPKTDASAAPEATVRGSVSARAMKRPRALKWPRPTEHTVLSPVYRVDKIYKSMTGPNSTQQLTLRTEGPAELLWITGFEARMVGADGSTSMPQQFMCHTNLDVDASRYMERFGGRRAVSGRLFTLSQGQYRIDFPAGHGIPIVSDQPLDLNTQVLNLNEHRSKPEVRHQVTVRYVRDKDALKPFVPLYSAGVYGLKLLQGKDGHHGVEQGTHDPDHHGPGCLPGANAGSNEFDDDQGRVFTGHWVVEPGREVNHTRVTDILALPYDTTVHYIAVHLHPFATSMGLLDRTTGKMVWQAETRQLTKGIGLDHVDFFSSAAGLKLHKSHEYEVVSVYENTSGEPQDSMAVFNLYLRDMEFRKPDLNSPKGGSREPSPSGPASNSPKRPKGAAM